MNWDPLHQLATLHRRVDQRHIAGDASWTPAVDLLETHEAFILVAELPGFQADDVTIEATAGTLLLAGERSPAPGRFLRIERGSGSFARRFEFGEDIVVDAITATFERGLLTIRVPKASASHHARIVIR
jgi:HSP20 family protein